MKSNLSPESEFASSTLPTTLSRHSPQGDAGFSFRSYQRDDLARAALHDGAIIGWDPGMGKTMAIFTLPFLKNARYALIVAPAGLHEQIRDEGREKFGLEVTPIPDQETAYRLMREGKLPFPHQVAGFQCSVFSKSEEQAPSAASSLKTENCKTENSAAEPRFFITAYNWLGYNGGDEWNPNETTDVLRNRRLMVLRRTAAFPDPALANTMADAKWKTKGKADEWAVLSLPHNAPATRIRTALRTAAMLFHPALHGGDPDTYWRWTRIFNAATTLLKLQETAAEILAAEIAADPAILSLGESLAAIEKGIGEEHDLNLNTENLKTENFSIKCVFRPTLASILCGTFDFVVCDEAVRLKSGTAYNAQGVLRMQSRCRFALTGTPIKNKLPDFFFLASWVTGHTREAIARWPYGNTTEHRGQFARDFGVMEENLTKGEQAAINGKKAPPPKTTNQICNVHRLWRILGPVILRRRKADVPDCDIVPKTVVPIRVMPGAEQKRVYRFHLDHAPEHNSILASLGAQLQNLRQAALNPCSGKLTHGGRNGRSTNPWTPKFAAILRLAADLLLQREQLVIFSPFTDFSDALAARFREAGVPNLVLDGNTSPEKRGSLIKKFRSREIPILIAGIDSMGEGFNLDNACHLVLPALSWAFDSNTQAVDRVHRLTSKKPVTIYVMVTQGTIEERLTAIWQEKGDSSDLALDGRLSVQDRLEIDVGQLLRDAVKDFDPKAPSLDETEVLGNWSTTLLPALTAAGKEYASQSIHVAAVCDRRKNPTEAPVQPTIPTPPAKRPTLFDLMKSKRPTTDRESPDSPVPSSTDHCSLITAHSPPSNIIPFPGRLGAARPTGTPVTMPRVNLAELLRR